MSDTVTLRTRKFMTNRLLGRKQMVIDVLHPMTPTPSKSDLCKKLSTMYKAAEERVQVFGLRTNFGGNKSTGFALIYDDDASFKKFEPKYRLVRAGVIQKTERPGRQQRKQRKNKNKKFRGTERRFRARQKE